MLVRESEIVLCISWLYLCLCVLNHFWIEELKESDAIGPIKYLHR